MSVSVYSVVMAVIWFTLATLIGSYTLHRASKHGLLFVTAILLLSVLRIFLPVDWNHSIVVRSVRLYPLLQKVMRTELVGEITVGACLIVCWMLGACACLLLLLRKLLLQRKFRRAAQCQETDADLLDLLHEISREAGYSGPVAVAVSAKATTAYQAGFIRPYIVLPHTIDTFSSTDIRNMLRHELCHFLGGDLWIKVGLQIMSCILWWNPAVILLRRNAEQMLELRCDRRACASLTADEQVSYLDTLLRLLSDERPEAFKVAMEYSGGVEEAEILQRFQMILQGKTQVLSTLKTAMGYLLCASLFVISYLVILQPWVPSPEINEIDAGFGTVDIDLDTSYIVCESDGILKFYCNGDFFFTISEATRSSPPFDTLPIIYEQERNDIS